MAVVGAERTAAQVYGCKRGTDDVVVDKRGQIGSWWYSLRVEGGHTRLSGERLWALLEIPRGRGRRSVTWRLHPRVFIQQTSLRLHRYRRYFNWTSSDWTTDFDLLRTNVPLTVCKQIKSIVNSFFLFFG